MSQNDTKRPTQAQALIAAGVTVPAVGELVNYRYRTTNQVKPPQSKTNRLVVVSEGGPNSVGGSGHDAVARAVAEAHDKKFGKGSSKIIFSNEYNSLPKAHNKMETAYQKLTNAPTLTEKAKALPNVISSYFTTKVTNRSNLKKDITDFKADRVVSTHPHSTTVLSKVGIKPEQVVTDYGVETPLARSFWDNPNAGAQYSPTGNVGKADVKINSIPVMERNLSSTKVPKTKNFEWEIRDAKKNVLRKQTISNNRPTILAISGSTGAQLDSVVTEALKSKKDFNLVAVTGKNQELFDQLSKIKDPRLVVQGFETNLDGLMSRSQLGLVRPHGISSTEIAGKGLPFIPVVTARKGTDAWAPHMKGNAKYFSNLSGIPYAALDDQKGKRNVAKILDNSLDNLKQVTKDSQKLTNEIRKNSAKAIVDSSNKTQFKAPKGIVGRAALYGTAAGLVGAGALASKDKLKIKKPTIDEVGSNVVGAGVGAGATYKGILQPMLQGTPGSFGIKGGIAASTAVIGGSGIAANKAYTTIKEKRMEKTAKAKKPLQKIAQEYMRRGPEDDSILPLTAAGAAVGLLPAAAYASYKGQFINTLGGIVGGKTPPANLHPVYDYNDKLQFISPDRKKFFRPQELLNQTRGTLRRQLPAVVIAGILGGAATGLAGGAFLNHYSSKPVQSPPDNGNSQRTL